MGFLVWTVVLDQSRFPDVDDGIVIMWKSTFVFENYTLENTPGVYRNDGASGLQLALK